jgi:DegV family protein with EDD domain
MLAGLGGSIQVVRTEDLLRVHIHTNDPQSLFAMARPWGEVLNSKADDMREQHRLLTADVSQSTVIIADSANDLPDETLDRFGIGLVPLQVIIDDKVYQDRLEMSPVEFHALLREGKARLSTSQPSAAAFTAAFEHARASADEVVAVVLSSGLSGTYANAVAAARAFAPGGVHVVDSLSASFGIGLLALRGAELAEDGWNGTAIVRELVRVRGQSGLFITVDMMDHLLRSGRISRFKAFLAGVLDLKPILTLDAEGRVIPVDRVRGRQAVLPRVLGLMERALPDAPRRLRMGVAHVDCPEVAEQIRAALVQRFKPVDVFVAPATAVVATHVGPGAWAVFWQVEDGTPDGAGNKQGGPPL